MKIDIGPAMVKRYPAYKDSGVEWLGEIPEGWGVKKTFHYFKAEKGRKAALLTKEFCSRIKGQYPVYSGQTDNNGVMSLISEYEFDYEKEGCLLSTTVGAKAMSIKYLDCKFNLSQNCMIIIKKHKEINTKFYYYHFQPIFNNYRNLIPDHMQASFRMEDLYQFIFFLPPLPEQTAIADFLDEQCNKLDRAVAQKEKLVELLKERKQIMIQDAVTKGLCPEVKMKNSGVEWIGEIPEHWDVKKCKYLFYEIDERSLEGREELLSVSHMTGVTPRSEKDVNMFLAENYAGSKLCQKGDLVYNIMWTWMGALGVANQTGIVSPSYGVYRQKNPGNFNPVYLEELLKSNKYIAHYNKVSTGLHSSRLRFYSHMFFNMMIAFPAMKEQEPIVVHIQAESARIDKAVALQEKLIEKLKEYKAILINSAVTGKIKVGE